MSVLEFHAGVELDGPVPVLHLTGELDAATLDVFDDAVHEALGSRPSGLVIDLSGLTFVGSCGLGRLIRVNQVVAGVVLRGIRPAQRRVLEITGVDAMFAFDGDVAPATISE